MKSKYLLFLLITAFGFSLPVSNLTAEETAPKELTSESLTAANAALESSYGEGKGKAEVEVKEKINVAVDANSEAGKALEAAKAKAGEIVANPAWAGLEPKVEVGKWGQEIRIIVKPSGKMKSDSLLAIKSVKLETVKGEFLGLKTYAADEKSRDAEFMVNPEILKIDSVKITVSSGVIGEYATTASLTPSEPEVKAEEALPAAAAEKAVEKVAETPAADAALAVTNAAQEVKAQEAPKKKKGWW